ncbi:norsolorinic acid reductase [Verticillium alfalfae VaMs.102]|uniref:Norsolorinic acid reductase n=1 Tax=Verticillium alfalfae (strain VaMs.102 / ATCC MYA-4576 / FGSC 10136) TaxID=526221 RepID=C9SHX6_VERA1|nr:norsolorinic acid reductase [Verticillium alfalfae VaMs.102]EEY18549.1 norsolorinic acid reductase [Verticillium alfalfae VaMs.102]
MVYLNLAGIQLCGDVSNLELVVKLQLKGKAWHMLVTTNSDIWQLLRDYLSNTTGRLLTIANPLSTRPNILRTPGQRFKISFQTLLESPVNTEQHGIKNTDSYLRIRPDVDQNAVHQGSTSSTPSNKSIERLGTYIDVLQIHRLDRDVEPEEIMKALNDVVESGKVRYIGASTMATWEFQRLQNVAEKHGWHKFISMQGLYNLLTREDEREMIPFCKATGVGLMPWSPLSAGMLTHAWTDRSDPREKSDVFLKALFRGREEAADEAIVGRVEELSKKKGISMAQIAIAWVLSKGTSPICGLESKERIDQAIEALTVELTEDEINFLEEPYLPKPAFFA